MGVQGLGFEVLVFRVEHRELWGFGLWDGVGFRTSDVRGFVHAYDLGFRVAAWLREILFFFLGGRGVGPTSPGGLGTPG